MELHRELTRRGLQVRTLALAPGREAGLSERELAVTFPGEIGLMLGLDIDMVLQQDPIDWTVRPDTADYLV